MMIFDGWTREGRSLDCHHVAQSCDKSVLVEMGLWRRMAIYLYDVSFETDWGPPDDGRKWTRRLSWFW